MSPTPFINPGSFAPARFGTINALLGLVVPLMFTVVTLVALVILIKGAFTFLTAGGDSAKLEEAQHTFQMAGVGVIIIFISFFLVRLIAHVLEIPFLL